MVNLQGPVAKGKTGLSIAADGNMSYDAQTIVARTPTGQINDQIRRPVDGVNVTVRLEQALGPTSSLRAEYSRRDEHAPQSRGRRFRSRRARLRRRHRRPTRCACATRARLARKCSASCASSSHSREYVVIVGVQRCRRFACSMRSRRAAPGSRASAKAASSPSRRTSISPSRSTCCAPACEVDGGWWDSTQQSNANGTFTFSSLDDFLAGRPRTYTRRVGDPQRQLLAVRGGLVSSRTISA